MELLYKPSTMSYHYNEIRYRAFYIIYSLICTLITCYYYQLELMYLLSRPFLQLNQILQSTDITEALSTTYKLCIYMSLGICIFHCIYQYWSFLVPSRYTFERRKITFFLVLFVILFCLETYLIYFFIFPEICELFSSFQIYVKTETLSGEAAFKIVEMSPRIESTVNSSIKIYFLLCLFFQIPVLFLLLFYLNYCNCFSICRYRKVVFFCIICLSALISPPEILSQLCCFFVIVFLFEFSLWLGCIYFVFLEKNTPQ